MASLFAEVVPEKKGSSNWKIFTIIKAMEKIEALNSVKEKVIQKIDSFVPETVTERIEVAPDMNSVVSILVDLVRSGDIETDLLEDIRNIVFSDLTLISQDALNEFVDNISNANAAGVAGVNSNGNNGMTIDEAVVLANELVQEKAIYNATASDVAEELRLLLDGNKEVLLDAIERFIEELQASEEKRLDSREHELQFRIEQFKNFLDLAGGEENVRMLCILLLQAVCLKGILQIERDRVLTPVQYKGGVAFTPTLFQETLNQFGKTTHNFEENRDYAKKLFDQYKMLLKSQGISPTEFRRDRVGAMPNVFNRQGVNRTASSSRDLRANRSSVDTQYLTQPATREAVIGVNRSGTTKN